MKLIQYWDTGEPPDEVIGWLESFRAMNPDMETFCFNRGGASWFIRKRFGPRERAAFEACAVPAMQADYFRLAALVAWGGVWADLDNVCAAPLVGLLRGAPEGIIPVIGNRLTNCFLAAWEPGNPFFRACLDLATERIERRIERGVYDITGPGVLNAVRLAIGAIPEDNPHLQLTWEPPYTPTPVLADPAAVREALLGLTRVHVLSLEPWLQPVEAAYKDTPDHWLHWTGSIYAP